MQITQKHELAVSILKIPFSVYLFVDERQMLSKNNTQENVYNINNLSFLIRGYEKILVEIEWNWNGRQPSSLSSTCS